MASVTGACVRPLELRLDIHVIVEVTISTMGPNSTSVTSNSVSRADIVASHVCIESLLEPKRAPDAIPVLRGTLTVYSICFRERSTAVMAGVAVGPVRRNLHFR